MRSTGLFNASSFLQCFGAVGLVMAGKVTGQLKDMPTRGLDISRTSQLADWTSCRLDNSQLQMPPKERKLSTQSRRWHPQVVLSATCPVRKLSSPRVETSPYDVQSMSRPVRKLAVHKLAYPRVVQ